MTQSSRQHLRNVLLSIIGILGAVAVGWNYRFDIIVMLAALKQPPTAPYHAVTWAKGPDTPAAGRRGRPNIVFILADDLGFNDITLNGGGVAGGAVPTPNIDAIAREGVSFANGYAGNATCAPSRAAIMTGRYATRFGFEYTPTTAAFSQVVGGFHSPGALHDPHYLAAKAQDMPADDDLAIPASEITIARMLKAGGYHTLHLGKWHLGGVKGARPEDQGFDESLGFIAGASKYLPSRTPARASTASTRYFGVFCHSRSSSTGPSRSTPTPI